MRRLSAFLLVFALALALPGCMHGDVISPPVTPAQALDRAELELLRHLDRMAVYLENTPTCSATVLVGCASQAVKDGIVAASDAANDAMDTARAAQGTGGAPDIFAVRRAIAGLANRLLAAPAAGGASP